MISSNPLARLAEEHNLHMTPTWPTRSNRSIMDIDQDLLPLTTEITKQWKKQLGFFHSAYPISKRLVCNAIHKPVSTLVKLAVLALFGYISYLLFRGTFAGIEVDFDSEFSHIFSRDRETRLYTGLNMTNGDQAGQFLLDGVVTAIVVFQLFFKEPYHCVASGVINQCYKPYLTAMRACFRSMEASGEFNEDELIAWKENMDRLYERMEKDLDAYGATPESYLQRLEGPKPFSTNVDEEDPAGLV